MSTTPPAVELKPGYTTTEWWGHVLVLALAFVATILSLVHPGATVPGWVAGWVPVVSTVAALVSQGIYLASRHRLKLAALEQLVADAAPVVGELAAKRGGTSKAAS